MGFGSTEAAAVGRVGDYVLLRRIAVGGMAEIFEARLADQPDSPIVALKLLLPQCARDEELVRMLEHEAALNAALEHPNLIRVLGFGTAGGKPHLVMELVDGLSLSELVAWLARQGRAFTRALALHVVHQALRALEYVHEATGHDGGSLGIVHRDVTPQNVLLSRNGEVRLGDFGIARSALRDVRTRTGVIKGKLKYLAPEQVTGSAIDARTDLYSAGLVLFELVTGEPYLRAESEIQLLRAAEDPEPRRASDVVAVGPCLDRLLCRAVARFPEERQQSARAMLQELDAAIEELGQTADADDLAALVREAIAGGARSMDDGVADTAVASPAAWVEAPVAAAVSSPAQTRSVRTPFIAAAAGLGVAGVVTAAVFLGSASDPAGGPIVTNTRIVAVSDGGSSAATAPERSLTAPDGGAQRATTTTDAGVGLSVPGGPRARHSPPDAGGRVAPPPVDPANEARRDAVAARAAAVRASIAQRGILLADLTSDQRASLATVDTALGAGRFDAAEAGLDAVEAQLSALRVDAEFVRRKMERVDARIREAARRGVTTSRLEELSALALQDLMQGRHDATNRRLNEILRLLGRQR